MKTTGKVYIVGAGPGDPELLTIKAEKLIRSAEVILFDSLISEEILKLISPQALQIHAGKRCGNHVMKQEEINSTLVEWGLKSNRVVRLKGGDPFIFGRGSEEITALMQGIDFEIIPGISSSIAAPMYAGVPVTHRNLACSFAVITGHENPQKETTQIKWDKIIGIDTLVFLMGIQHRQEIAKKLIQAGKSKNTPVLFVSHGTRSNQKSTRCTLQDVIEQNIEIEMPAVFLVGEVASFNLSWFEKENTFSRDLLPEFQPFPLDQKS